MSFVYAFFHTHTLSSVWASWLKPIIPRHPAADVRVQIFLLFSTCCLTNFKCIYRMRCSSFPMTKHYSFSSLHPFPSAGLVSRFPFIKHSCQAATILFVYKKTKVPMFQFVNVKVICCRHLQRLRGCHELSSSAKETKDPDRLKTRVYVPDDGAIRK